MKIMIFILTLNIMFMFMKHPMSMGLVLIAQTIMVAMYSGTMMKTFWMSYIMVIIILSGMLVLFIYMASIASNEKFKNTKKSWAWTLMLVMIMNMSLMFLNSDLLEKKIMTSNHMLMTKSSETIFLQKMFTNENMYINILLMSYLFYTMIVVNYLVNIHEGPMKTSSKNSYE